MIGQTISHYEILEKLGEGGMGVVYKARDTLLDRFVALKFLPAQFTQDEKRRERFITEAKAASALDHPHICTIHEINETDEGQLYICMAFYEGNTLKERIKDQGLRIKDAVNFTIQIAQGLQRAHEEGIIHRDIKPANIMITDRGEVKILDFGLAKLAGKEFTETISTKGTIAYMSPEIIRGLAVDQRSDIWSLGVVLYEMLTGHLPFRGEYAEPLMYAILNEMPVSIGNYREDLPGPLEAIIEKMLQKDLEKRYQDETELLKNLDDLNHESQKKSEVMRKRDSKLIKNLIRWRYQMAVLLVLILLLILFGYQSFYQTHDSAYYPFTAEEWRRIEEVRNREFVIAVLPFWGMNDETIQEGRVMQAMVERELLKELGTDPQVKILKVDNIQLPKNHSEAITQGRTLNAHLVIWGEIFILQDEVEIQPYVTTAERLIRPWSVPVKTASEALQINLSAQGQLSFRRTKAEELSNLAFLITGNYYMIYEKNDIALDIFKKIEPQTSLSLALQGEVYYKMGDNKKAEDLFLQALSLDSSKVSNYLRLAWHYNFSHRFDEAKELAQKAIELNPEHAESYKALGWVYYNQHNFEVAIEQLHKALELNPNSEDYHFCLGWVYRMQGKYSLARSAYEEAIELNPSYEWAHIGLGMTYRSMRQFKKAEKSFTKAIELNPQVETTYRLLATVYSGQNRYELAHEELEKSIKLAPNNSLAYMDLGLLYNRQEMYHQAETALKKALELDPDDGWLYSDLGVIYRNRGSYEQALSLSQKAIQMIPTSSIFHLRLAMIHIKLGNYELAIRECKKAQQLDPDGFFPQYQLSKIYFLQNQFDSAESELKKTFELLDKQDISGYVYATRQLGCIKLATGQYHEAAELFKQNMERISDHYHDIVYYFIALNKTRQHQIATIEINEFIGNSKVSYNSWRTKLALFLADKISVDSLLAETNTHEYPKIERERKTEAYLHIGLSYLQTGNSSSEPTHTDTLRAIEYLKKCIDEDVHYYVENILAKQELSRLEKSKVLSHAKK